MATSVPLIPAVSFSHIGLFATDLSVMENFYRGVLGFVVTDRGQLASPRGPVDLVFLSRDPTEHHQIVLASGRPTDLSFNVVNQISFRVGDLGSLRHFHDSVTAAGASELAPVTHGNAISLYFRDPEGNRVELFFDTPWYCEQPCREPVDFACDNATILRETEALARSLPGFKPREQWQAELKARIEGSVNA
jgi:catechol 2,3-dioxygenase